MMTAPLFPPVIDSSMRAAFVACPEQFRRRYLEGLSRRGRSIHLVFGGAFADGLASAREAFYAHGMPAGSALNEGIRVVMQKWPSDETGEPISDDFYPAKSLDRCVGALEAYFNQYPLGFDSLAPAEFDGSRAIEFNFALPLPLRHPMTHEPLLYAGRFDMIGTDRTGAMFGLDDKTTTQLGPQWGRQWRLRAQFTGYCWAAQQFGIPLSGFYIRGISILKAAGSYGHAEVIEQRPQFMIDQWYVQLLVDIERMKRAWLKGQWDKNLDSACSAYGGCAFLDLCTSPNPDRWLGEYEVVKYDPLEVED